MAAIMMYAVLALQSLLILLAACDNDVPVDQVIMDENPVLLQGRQGDLQCRFRGEPVAVFWMKGDTYETADDLITFHKGATTVQDALNEGLYDIGDNYYLVINNVTMETAGIYFCRVSDFRGYIIRSHTNVTVKVPPKDPYPTVDQCDDSEYCSVDLQEVTSANLTCRAEGASTGLVSLAWTSPPGCTVGPDPVVKRLRHPDSYTEDISATITFEPCSGEFSCRATLAATRVGVSTVSVNVTAPAQMISTTALTTTQEGGILTPASSNKSIMIVIAVVVPLLVILLIAAVVWRCYRRRPRYSPVSKIEPEYTGPISYFELWVLVKSGDDETFDQKFSSMIEGLIPPEDDTKSTVSHTDETFAFECNSTELRNYQRLCAWKRRTQTSGVDQGCELFKALQEAGLGDKVELLQDCRNTGSDTLSDEDLKHICWSVHGQKKTVRKGLRLLSLHDLPAGSANPSKPDDTPASEKADDKKSAADENRNDDPIKKDFELLKEWRNRNERNVASNEPSVSYSATTARVDSSATRISQKIEMCLALEEAGFHDIAHSFFLISDKNKQLSTEDLEEFAMEISGRHCSELAKGTGLSAEEIQTRKRENGEIFFDTVGLLRDWIAKQLCSNYDIRCKLSKVAEKSGRSDLIGVFVKPQEYASIKKGEAAMLKVEDEKSQGEQAYDVTDDEIKRIQLLGGQEQINKLVQKSLIEEKDGKYMSAKEVKSANFIDRHSRHKFANTPRYCIHASLAKTNNGFLMPNVGEKEMSNVELVDVARRIVMKDLQCFTESLLDELGKNAALNDYSFDNRNDIVGKGTFAILKIHENEANKQLHPRAFLANVLIRNGYPDIAKIIILGSHYVGSADIQEVAKAVKEKRADIKKLLDQLEVGNMTLPISFNSEDVDHVKSVLATWKHNLPNPGYNHRTVLADAVFLVLEDRQLALDILSGDLRKKSKNELQQHLAKRLSPDEIKSLFGPRNLLEKGKGMLGLSSETKQLSDKLLEIGSFDLAFEVLEGIKSEKDNSDPKPQSPTCDVQTNESQGIASEKESSDPAPQAPADSVKTVKSQGETVRSENERSDQPTQTQVEAKFTPPSPEQASQPDNSSSGKGARTQPDGAESSASGQDVKPENDTMEKGSPTST